MKNFFTIIKEIAKGKSLIRTMMNLELKDFKLSGKVLDIGGGKNPSYLRFFKKEDGLNFISLDLMGENKIDLEKESLPYKDKSVDQVLLFNILEHIYNHKFLVNEVRRVLKDDGQVIGFVPFLVGYHPDPHDYFRYTNESLERIFKDAGFSSIVIQSIGGGPFLANYNIIMDYMPRVLRIFLFPFYLVRDSVILKIKPSLVEKFSLGYLFVIKK
ncbi:MAG: hypothetical protein COT80_02385 [Candidatus Buchananbacteria bacterium CG10_big_fil_rev_8_21_14_0_10_33_19]|uniref:Methyltransferase type 11 domain-containing protein n=1 Tax=Candidatus Buchananbacteria bacterium CG10_big_fil_rev_8_21_14_0_10_33_19 TaxID=1974525 RepID=A0A2H0W654_9BACT|nr:MAG: hypothetical protein COT80_02385 [Candidatus Buchananbacteria bacterium CG10_big_fil_rev_8_21_14_0_10_33_19]